MFRLGRGLAEQIAVEAIVGVREEGRRAAIATLCHVVGHAWNNETGDTSHAAASHESGELVNCHRNYVIHGIRFANPKRQIL